ncbi:hypothetical protein POTOM_029827 [Populus tomentosa]|uniref:Ethanolaminephosphotransferase n=1 Tax=Populus tomentosa TaxID=118781 RepID=A0A8X8CTE1_POPTO|nr:hypothetical protein POTOM_029827 [Populus tomentosa]
MGYIGSHGIAALHKYKYSGVDHSCVAKYVLQPFWTRFVNLFPLWMPPNMTFDAVDGKQARRTNSSSPLGELFDHGCDALACAFESMAFGSTAMCGRDAFWFWLISAVPFYCATWEKCRVVGSTVCNVFPILELVAICKWGGGGLGVSAVADVFEFSSMGSFVPLVSMNCLVSNVYKVVQARKGSMLLALAMLYPFVVLVGGVLLWDYLSPSDLMSNYPHLVILGTGLAFGFLVWVLGNWELMGRMILSHLCDEPKGLKTNMCMSLLYLPFAIANALAARLNDGVALVDEFWVLLGYCVFTMGLYLHLATSVIHEITTALGIYCFRVTRKKA